MSHTVWLAAHQDFRSNSVESLNPPGKSDLVSILLDGLQVRVGGL